MNIPNPFSRGEREMPVLPPGNPEYAPMYAAWEQEDLTGTIGVALDNSSLVQQIESFLSGKVVVEKTDPKTGKKVATWEQVAEPKMNERGVRAIVLELRSLLDKNSIMTYFPTYDDLIRFMDNFATNIAIYLGRNAEEFEIKDNYLSAVCDHIVNMVLITLQRGIEGNEKQGVYKQNKRIENYTIPLNDPRNMAPGRGGGLFRG
jgi:hypothetical protein